eukprot:7487566-Pyramimonas_sp.AAC.1
MTLHVGQRRWHYDGMDGLGGRYHNASKYRVAPVGSRVHAKRFGKIKRRQLPFTEVLSERHLLIQQH